MLRFRTPTMLLNLMSCQIRSYREFWDGNDGNDGRRSVIDFPCYVIEQKIYLKYEGCAPERRNEMLIRYSTNFLGLRYLVHSEEERYQQKSDRKLIVSSAMRRFLGESLASISLSIPRPWEYSFPSSLDLSVTKIRMAFSSIPSRYLILSVGFPLSR